jgi:[NiFe] hydrogenase small subunit
MEQEREFYERLDAKGVSRRDFMKFCTFLTATMGLSSSFVPKVAEVFAGTGKRTPVVWMHFSECTGCSEGFLRSMYPWVDELILEVLSVDYHETIMAAAGHQAEENLHESIRHNKGQYIAICEGAVPTKDGGVYGKIGGRPMMDIANEVCRDAAAVICIGNCSCFGGIQSAAPNLGGFKSVAEATGVKTVNIAGCPPNPINLVGTVVNFLLMGRLPDLDAQGRPLFGYGKTIHDQCPRRAHFEMGEFVTEFGSEEERKGFCLYPMGCRGPETYNNCPIVKFQGGTSWPIQAGHPCIGCSEPKFFDKMTPFYEEM